MNLTILRSAVWLIAAMAFGYVLFAYWYWRPGEILIAAGVLAICLPVDIALRHEQRARRDRSPFGPVQKWGMR